MRAIKGILKPLLDLNGINISTGKSKCHHLVIRTFFSKIFFPSSLFRIFSWLCWYASVGKSYNHNRQNLNLLFILVTSTINFHKLLLQGTATRKTRCIFDAPLFTGNDFSLRTSQIEKGILLTATRFCKISYVLRSKDFSFSNQYIWLLGKL